MFDCGQKAYGKGMYGCAIEFLECALRNKVLLGRKIQFFLWSDPLFVQVSINLLENNLYFWLKITSCTVYKWRGIEFLCRNFVTCSYGGVIVYKLIFLLLFYIFLSYGGVIAASIFVNFPFLLIPICLKENS